MENSIFHLWKFVSHSTAATGAVDVAPVIPKKTNHNYYMRHIKSNHENSELRVF